LDENLPGVDGEIAKLLNLGVARSKFVFTEIKRTKEAITGGDLGARANTEAVGGPQKKILEYFNEGVEELTVPVDVMAKVVRAVADGNLALEIEPDKLIRGGQQRIIGEVQRMLDTLHTCTSEITRVIKEFGIEGKLGVQACVSGLQGTWKGLTENVNTVVQNLASQVRDIAHVTTSVAKGNLSKKMSVPAKGEILELKDTINTMVDQLNSFASEVTRVAREVGTEGKLGGQAQVKDVAGTWKDLTDNVNMMAANLTGQVR